MKVPSFLVLLSATAAAERGGAGDDGNGAIHGLLRRGVLDERRLVDALHRKLAQKAASTPSASASSSAATSRGGDGGRRRLDASGLAFLPCAAQPCGRAFPALTRQELVDLLDSVVAPALGIASDPACATATGDCCNDDGFFFSFCYGNAACGGGGFALGSCPSYPGVDADGCCSNYAASGIRAEVREIVNHGVQARKICASCEDFEFGGECYDDFCGADVYGRG